MGTGPGLWAVSWCPDQRPGDAMLRLFWRLAGYRKAFLLHVRDRVGFQIGYAWLKEIDPEVAEVTKVGHSSDT